MFHNISEYFESIQLERQSSMESVAQLITVNSFVASPHKPLSVIYKPAIVSEMIQSCKSITSSYNSSNLLAANDLIMKTILLSLETSNCGSNLRLELASEESLRSEMAEGMAIDEMDIHQAYSLLNYNLSIVSKTVLAEFPELRIINPWLNLPKY